MDSQPSVFLSFALLISLLVVFSHVADIFLLSLFVLALKKHKNDSS